MVTAFISITQLPFENLERAYCVTHMIGRWDCIMNINVSSLNDIRMGLPVIEAAWQALNCMLFNQPEAKLIHVPDRTENSKKTAAGCRLIYLYFMWFMSRVQMEQYHAQAYQSISDIPYHIPFNCITPDMSQRHFATSRAIIF